MAAFLKAINVRSWLFKSKSTKLEAAFFVMYILITLYFAYFEFTYRPVQWKSHNL